VFHHFPNDETGDALRRMQENGDDFTRPRDINFTVVFPSRSLAEAFADDFRGRGYRVSVEKTKCVPELPWDVVIVSHMIPLHSNISEREKMLEETASPLGGRNEGWGCFTRPKHQ
jgi:hypothetical protein